MAVCSSAVRLATLVLGVNSGFLKAYLCSRKHLTSCLPMLKADDNILSAAKENCL